MKDFQERVTVLHPFEPIYDENSRVLILGTIPSETSREKGFYYASRSNKFWNLISDICECTIPETNEKKKEMLLNNHIAIWDVFEKTSIIKSFDASIKRANSSGTDILSIINSAKINKIFANGSKAQEGYEWFDFKKTGIPIERLPSSSGLYTGMTYQEKLKAWSIIREYIK